MAGKLLIVLALAIVACSYVQADLEKYVRFSGGQEGHRERCFVEFALKNEIRRYARTAVAKELRADLGQVSDVLDEEFWMPKARSCLIYQDCFAETVKKVKAPTDFGDHEPQVDVVIEETKEGISKFMPKFMKCATKIDDQWARLDAKAVVDNQAMIERKAEIEARNIAREEEKLAREAEKAKGCFGRLGNCFN